MNIRSALAGAGAVVLIGGGVFTAGLVANAQQQDDPELTPVVEPTGPYPQTFTEPEPWPEPYEPVEPVEVVEEEPVVQPEPEVTVTPEPAQPAPTPAPEPEPAPARNEVAPHEVWVDDPNDPLNGAGGAGVDD